MPVVVILKAISDSAFLFMLMGSIAVHFGTPAYLCVVTCVLICISQMLSYMISKKNKKLRLLALLLPLVSLALPGKNLSWAIICGIIFGYCIFVCISGRFIPDDDVQKTIFKISIGAFAAMLLIMLMIKGSDTSYMIVVISAIVSICSNILIMRSLRHEPEVYSKLSYQAVNIVIMAVIVVISILLGTKSVVSAVGTALKTVYTGIATAVMTAITYIIRALTAVFGWLPSISCSGEEKSTEEINLDMRSAADLYGNVQNTSGFPEWLKIVLIVIGALIVLLLLVLILKRLAGRKVRDFEIKESVITEKTEIRTSKSRDPAQVGAVRKQYRKYLELVLQAGGEVKAYETTHDIKKSAPEKLRGAAAEELRRLYLEARYNGCADKEDAVRAKELVRMIKG